MTVRITFKLSTDLDVDSQAAEEVKLVKHDVTSGDGQAGTVQRSTRNDPRMSAEFFTPLSPVLSPKLLPNGIVKGHD